MSDLVRKQVYITRDQENLLKEKTAVLGISEAEIIREALDRQAQQVSYPHRPAEKWQEEIQFILRRMSRDDSLNKEGGKRDVLYDRQNPDRQ